MPRHVGAGLGLPRATSRRPLASLSSLSQRTAYKVYFARQRAHHLTRAVSRAPSGCSLPRSVSQDALPLFTSHTRLSGRTFMSSTLRGYNPCLLTTHKSQPMLAALFLADSEDLAVCNPPLPCLKPDISLGYVHPPRLARACSSRHAPPSAPVLPRSTTLPAVSLPAR